MKNIKEEINEIEFFDLMQAYRIANPTDQDRVCKKFQDVKDWINEKFIKQNNEMFEALKACKSFIDSHSVALLDAEIELKENVESILKELKEIE